MELTRRNFLQAAAGTAAMVLAAGSARAQEKKGKGKRIKQSLAWWCFGRRGLKPEQLVREAASIGYASIEMPPRDQWDRIRDAGLAIAVIVGHRSLTDGLNRRENHSRIEDELSKNIELAVQYEIPGLVCFSGNRRGLPDDEGADITAEGFKRVAKKAEEKGVTLCMELLNSKVNHPDYQCDHTAWGVSVCKKVNSPAVKLLYDIYHMQIMEGDLIRTIRDNIKYISHFHTAGNPGRRDLDEQQEIYYPAVMRAIADAGYQGYVGHEFTPKGDVIEAMRKTFALCDV